MHAVKEMQIRGISREIVDDVVSNPEQKFHLFGDMWCCQSKIAVDEKTYFKGNSKRDL